MSSVKFGPAGTGMSSLEGVKLLGEKGINAAEIEFTYGVKMSAETAVKVGEAAKKYGVSLSVHAPYYINLASEEKAKIEASKKRIIDSCERAHQMGARYVVFHAAFYGKRTKEETYLLVKEAVVELQAKIKKSRWDVELAPETTGKASQFGDLDELLMLRKETGCSLTVDFAHLKARNSGKIDYKEVFARLKQLQHIHSHFSGIEFTEKGERRHILTSKEDFIPLLSEIKRSNADITVINESPDPLGDTILCKKLFASIK